MAEKILIVDDDVDSLKLIGLMLQRQGYSIVAAQNGEQALSLAESERPDLMLLDVMMPDMDGYEVCRRIRKNPQFAHVPIMMFTAKTLVDDKVAGFEAGADDYLTKPTHPAELAARIKLVLERSKRQHAAPTTTRRGRVYVLLAARSGVGATTVGINLGVSLIKLGYPTILAEMRPGAGSAGLQLGISQNPGLTMLRSKPISDISTRLVEGALATHSSRLRLLLASYDPRDAGGELSPEHAEALVRALAGLGEHLLVDLGAGLGPVNERVIALADEVLVIVEPARVTLAMADSLLRSLDLLGVDPARISLVTVSRSVPGLSTPAATVRALLSGREPLATITAAPELAFQSAENSTPMVMLQPDGPLAEEYREMAQQLTAKERPPSAPV
jgi:DNA-binding response OmpR family regulator